MLMEAEAKVGAERATHGPTCSTYSCGHRVLRFEQRLKQGGLKEERRVISDAHLDLQAAIARNLQGAICHGCNEEHSVKGAPGQKTFCRQVEADQAAARPQARIMLCGLHWAIPQQHSEAVEPLREG
jgi:hypothetical protein